jgi:replicative DNA helicase
LRERSNIIIIDNDTQCLFKTDVMDPDEENHNMGNKRETKRKPSKTITHVKGALDQFFFDMDNLQNDPIFGISLGSGFKFLNQLLVGKHAPRFSIIYVPEKYWTTALGASIIAELSIRKNRSIGYFSLSASTSYFISVLLSIVADVDPYLMRSGRLPSERWPDLATASRDLVATKLYIDDTRPLTVKVFRRQALKMIKKSKVDLFVIDNLQFILSKKPKRNKARNFQKICSSLKEISDELGVSILLMSEFSDEYDPDDIDVTNDCQSLPFLQDYGKVPDAELCLIPGKRDKRGRIFSLYICRNREGSTGMVKLSQSLINSGFKEIKN